MKTITFFNNKGGVGKTSLAYHVSWMLKELNYKVLSVDLDPQANLTQMFIDESHLEKIMENNQSLYSALEPLKTGAGDIKKAHLVKTDEGISLLAGDLKLSSLEDDFSETWPKCLNKEPRAFRITTAFSRLIKQAGEDMSADWAVIDMGPNLGAINRAVLISSDYVILPLGPDLFSHQGLKNAGAFLNQWREEWAERKNKKPEGLDFDLPEGGMRPIGYVMMRHSIRYDRPVKAYQRWIEKMPKAYSKYIMKEDPTPTSDKYLLAHLKDYRSLMPMAQHKNKPIFLLRPGDGAIGAHFQAVQDSYQDFKILTEKILLAIKERGAV